MTKDLTTSSSEHEFHPAPIPVGTLVIVYAVGLGPTRVQHTIKGLVVSAPQPGAGKKESYEVQLETGELVLVMRGYLTTIESWEVTRELLSGIHDIVTIDGTTPINTEFTKA
jgi:hypothetical protein